MYQPDFEQLLKVLRREKPDRPVLFEFFMSGPVQEKLAGGPIRQDIPKIDRIRACLRAFHTGGYDYAVVPGWETDFVCFPKGKSEKKNSYSQNEGTVIHDEASFAAYKWQTVKPEAYEILDLLRPDIPEGMKLIIPCCGGIEENMVELVGYEDLCFMQIDEPELVKRIADAIGSRLLAHYEHALKHDTVGAIMINDDWGFKTQTLMSPAFLREHIVPWYRKIAAAAHAAGRSVLMHSCGDLHEVWNDIIDDIKVDGKHSYEDGILPVENSYDEYGHRIAILGGIDMDFLCRKTPDEIYKRSAEMIERTGGCRAYALGSGNSIADYVPVANYEAMTRAALEKR
jgi:uroporphyrinogen decarboxylase